MFSDIHKSTILHAKHQITEKVKDMAVGLWGDYALPWKDVFLSGGAIGSLLRGEAPKDWDFYFTTEKSMNIFKQHLMRHPDRIMKVDEKYKESVGVDGKMITANAITMEDGSSFITMMYGSPDTIRSQFDYVHCTPYFSLETAKLYISEKQYHACVYKKLIVNNSRAVKKYRTEKFLSRGYKHEDSGYSWNP